MEIALNCCNPGFELHMMGITTAGAPHCQTGYEPWEEFIAMLNSTTWPKGTRGRDCNANTVNCCDPWFELPVTGVTIVGTTWTNGGQALQEAVQMPQWLDLSWLWCPLTPPNMAPLLSWVTAITDRAQSHGHFVDNCGCFTDILQGGSTD